MTSANARRRTKKSTKAAPISKYSTVDTRTPPITSNISRARKVKPMNRKPYFVARLTCEYGSTGWIRLIEPACTASPPAGEGEAYSGRGAGTRSTTFDEPGSPVLTSERPSARLPTWYVASNPLAPTCRVPGRKSPPKLGLDQEECTLQRVSPAWGARLSEALPRNSSEKSTAI